MRRLLLLYSLCILTTPAMAIYKCEGKGKTSYSDVPCVDASKPAPPIRTGVPCSAARSRQQAQQQSQSADQLQQARLKRESQEQKEQQKIDKVRATKKQKCAALALRKKWGAEDAAAASGKAVEKARRDARRLVEQYEMECNGHL